MLEQDDQLFRLFNLSTTGKDGSLYLSFLSNLNMASVKVFKWKPNETKKKLDFRDGRKIHFPVIISLHESGLVRIHKDDNRKEFTGFPFHPLSKYKGNSFMLIDFLDLDYLLPYTLKINQNIDRIIEIPNMGNRMVVILYASYINKICEEDKSIYLGSISSPKWSDVLHLFYAINDSYFSLQGNDFIILGGFPFDEKSRRGSYRFFGIYPFKEVT